MFTGWLLIKGVWIGWRELVLLYAREVDEQLLFWLLFLVASTICISCCCCCCCCDDWFGVLCVEYDNSALWLSSESSLDNEDGGVGGKPKPVLLCGFCCWCAFSIRIFNLGTTIRWWDPFKMICWFFKRLWEAGDNCSWPFYSKRIIKKRKETKWIPFSKKNWFFFFVKSLLPCCCARIPDRYLCMQRH